MEIGATVCAVAVEDNSEANSRASSIPVLPDDRESLESFAFLNDIPLIRLSRDWSRNRDLLQHYAPDIILVSCFGRKLPDAILALPAVGCFNLHPSLLPAYRGPVPLFWQFRHGVHAFGITLHRMTPLLDAGDIIAQAGVELPGGIDHQQASRLLAEAGSKLLQRDEWAGCAQDESKASYYGFPAAADFAVSTTWSARRMYNFICATRERQRVYPCKVAGRVYRLVDADLCRESGRSALLIEGERITLPCSPGFVRARFEVG